MDLEFHQLDLRYAHLRVRHPARERRLLASLADTGQQMPIVVVAVPDAAHVVVDGYKRVRGLQRLHRDTVQAVAWAMGEAEALIFRQLLHTEAPDSALEHGWVLRTLHEDHGLSLEHLARRFDRSVSWVSRRLSLVRDLPAVIQQRVQDGRIVAHAAMKYLVPLARANRADCLRLVEAISAHALSTRQIGRLYQIYLAGPAPVRELVTRDPLLVLRVEQARTNGMADPPIPPATAAAFIRDVEIVAAVARRASGRLRAGLTLPLADRTRAWRACCEAEADVRQLHHRCGQEIHDARSGDPHDHSGLTDARPGGPPDCPHPADLAGRGSDGAGDRQPVGAPD